MITCSFKCSSVAPGASPMQVRCCGQLSRLNCKVTILASWWVILRVPDSNVVLRQASYMPEAVPQASSNDVVLDETSLNVCHVWWPVVSTREARQEVELQEGAR